MPTPAAPHAETAPGSRRRFLVGVVAVSFLSGVTGLAFASLLHVVEGLLWPHAAHDGGSTVANGIATTAWPLVVAIIVGAGILGGASWWLLLGRRNYQPVSATRAAQGTPMRVWDTVWHSTTQVIIVAMGASIGREVAPREVSAALAGATSDRLHLSAADRRLLVACAAGAGLSAVYTLPLAGAAFALEAVVRKANLRTVVVALVISSSAAALAATPHFLATGGLPAPFYQLSVDSSVSWWSLDASWSLLAWAVLAGPVVGGCGWLFSRLVTWAEANRPDARHLPWLLPTVFAVLAGALLAVPMLAGNGQAVAQFAFDQAFFAGDSLGQALAIAAAVCGLGVAKVVATTALIRAGTWGGTLTPALAVGACLGAAGGALWLAAWPGAPLWTFAFVGASAFLGVTMRAPLTAVLLVIEFTHAGVSLLAASLVAVIGAQVARLYLEKLRAARSR